MFSTCSITESIFIRIEMPPRRPPKRTTRPTRLGLGAAPTRVSSQLRGLTFQPIPETAPSPVLPANKAVRNVALLEWDTHLLACLQIINAESDISEKLLVSAINQADLRTANEKLLHANSELTEEIVALKKISDQKNQIHIKQMSKCAEDSHRQGHVAAVEEMKNVWSSKEFAAELMYGEQITSTVIIVYTKCKQGGEGKLIANTMPFVG